MTFFKCSVMTGLLGSMLMATTSEAAPSGTLSISGTVSLVNSIVVTPAGVYNTLNIVTGETNSTVANVDETSNNLLGYHITVASANAGELRNTSDVTKTTTYTVSYDSAPALAPTVSAQTVKNVSSLAGLTTNSSEVKINVTAYATAPAGTYTDTITFAIVAN